MTMKPEPWYSGPVEYMEPTYGAPYSIKEHCPRCGSTKLDLIPGKTKQYAYNGVTSECFRCRECNRKFYLPKYRHRYLDDTPSKENAGKRFRIVEGYKNNSDEEFGYDDIEHAMFEAAMDDDPNYYHKALEYYGDYYAGGEDDDDASWNEWRGSLESDLPWVESNNFIERGYADEMRVGDTYTMPDFRVKVKRVQNIKSGKYAQRRAKAKSLVGRR